MITRNKTSAKKSISSKATSSLSKKVASNLKKAVKGEAKQPAPKARAKAQAKATSRRQLQVQSEPTAKLVSTSKTSTEATPVVEPASKSNAKPLPANKSKVTTVGVGSNTEKRVKAAV